MASISANGSNGKQTFTLTVTETGTSTTANTSTISYSFTIGKSNQGSWPFSGQGTDISWSIVINGTTVKTGYIDSYDGSSTVTLGSGTTTVTHDAGGAKTMSYSFKVEDKYPALPGPGNASASGSMKLTTITVASYTLSISAGTGSTITVNRTSSPKGGGATGNLSNGAKIYYSDVLKITFGASTGYTIGTHTVNGSTFTSGNSHTVTAAVTVKSTATVNSYKLTITQGANSTITVNRTSSPKGGASTGNLSSGSTIYYSDVLKVTFTPATGYNIGTHTVNGSTFTSGNSHTVTAATTVVSSATVKSFTLSISAGSNSSITVNRTSSPKGGASTGNLSNGATIYYSDVLKISFSASTGYNVGTHTVNGASFSSGNNHTVTAAVSVVSTATVKSFTLSISAGTNSSITVNRTSSPKGGAATGNLSNNDTIYYSDVLTISFAADTGYDLTTHTVNGTEFTSGNSHTVTAAVSVVSTAQSAGSRLQIFTVNIFSGSNPYSDGADSQVPAPYEVLESVEGYGFTYVNTGIIPTNSLGFRCSFKTDASLAETYYEPILGSCSSNGVNDFQLTTYTTDDDAMDVNYGQIRYGSSWSPAYLIDDFGESVQTVSLINGVYTDPNGYTYTCTPNFNNATQPIYLLGLNNGGTYEGSESFTTNIYDVRFYNGTTEYKHFIPCKVTNGNFTTIGFYEVHDQQFYPADSSDELDYHEMQKFAKPHAPYVYINGSWVPAIAYVKSL